jgi:hypothetical protein
MCLSIGVRSVSIWKKAISNRRHGYRLHIYRAGWICRERGSTCRASRCPRPKPGSINPRTVQPAS